LAVFAYPYYTRQPIAGADNGKVFTFKQADQILASIYGADREVIPQNLNLSIISANEKISWREAHWRFQDKTKCNMLTKLIFSSALKTMLTNSALTIDNNLVQTIDIALCFVYKNI